MNSDKLAMTLGDTDSEFTDVILNEDATLQEKAMHLIRNLQHLEGKIKSGESQKDVHPDQDFIQKAI